MCKAIRDLMEDSRAEGIGQGIQQGRLETTHSIAIQMLQDGLIPLEKIAYYCQLTVEEVEALRA